MPRTSPTRMRHAIIPFVCSLCDRVDNFIRRQPSPLSTSPTGAITSTRKPLRTLPRNRHSRRLRHLRFQRNSRTRLLAGGTGYDLVVPSATFLQRQIKAGVYRKLDKTLIPNLKGIAPEISAKLNAYDPGGEYSVDYMWFTTGIAYNTKKIRNASAIRRWTRDIVFKPEIMHARSRIAASISWTARRICWLSRRVYLGMSPDLKDAGSISRAASVLSGVRRYVRKFHSSEYAKCAGQWRYLSRRWMGGRQFVAQNRAREAGGGVDINYVIPGKVRVDVAGHDSHSGTTRSTSPKRTNSSTSCCDRRLPHATRS